MRYGDEPLRERRSCAPRARGLRRRGAQSRRRWDWLQNTVLGGRVPVIDHMWQTETGGPVFGNPYGIGMLPIKPGSATIPLPGIERGGA